MPDTPDALKQIGKSLAKSQKDAKRANKKDYSSIIVERSRGTLGVEHGG